MTVFFASFITGSLLNQLALLLTNPQQVLTILGTGEAGGEGEGLSEVPTGFDSVGVGVLVSRLHKRRDQRACRLCVCWGEGWGFGMAAR